MAQEASPGFFWDLATPRGHCTCRVLLPGVLDQDLVSVGEAGGADGGILGAGTLTGVKCRTLWLEGYSGRGALPDQGPDPAGSSGIQPESPQRLQGIGCPLGPPPLLPRDLLAGRGPSPPHLLSAHPRWTPPALRLPRVLGSTLLPGVSQGMTHRALGLQVEIPT